MRLGKWGVAPLLAATILAAATAGAHASAVSGAAFRRLAASAANDPAALARLRQVDRVDGRRVDMAGALYGATRDQLRARLLALTGAPATATSLGARAHARAILAERRFHETRVTGPLRGLLDRIGRALPDLGGLIRWLDRLLPGGRAVVWIVLAALVLAFATLASRRVLSRRVAAAARPARATPAVIDDPRTLERRADAAQAAGDHALAVRLRFRAGLLRLHVRPSAPTGEVARELRSEDFDALARTFDEVVYGGRAAQSDDAEDARRRWPAVVAVAARSDRRRGPELVAGAPR